MVADYIIDGPTGKFGRIEINSTSDYQYPRSIRNKTIDLSIPRRFFPRDKSGNKTMIKQVKNILYGENSV